MKWKLILISLILTACSTAPYKVEFDNSLSKSRVEVNYNLGHDAYILLLSSNEKNFMISSYVNGQQLEHALLSEEQFSEFAQKVSDLVHSIQKESDLGIDPSCKAPFSIVVQNAGNKALTEGCRSEDENGQLGRLIREAEILFYSEKSPSKGAF